jgi:tRNA-dihydrouridine synthase B
LMAPPTLEERIIVCKKHLHKSFEWKRGIAGIYEMRRHYTNYLKGLPNIKDFRSRLVTLNTVEEVEAVLDELHQYYKGYEFERLNIELIDYHQKCPV